MIRIGIVGTGGMARQRAECFRSMPDTTVVGVCSHSKEKAAALIGEVGLSAAVAFEAYDALLDAADAVVLGLPNHLHASHALRALEHGRHVLVEYPLCTRPEEVTPVRHAAARCGCVLMVGNTIIHERMFLVIRRNLEPLGPLVSAASRVAFHGEELAGTWNLDPRRSGSPFAAYHYHHIEYYRQLLGEVAWVMAHEENIPSRAHPGCSSFRGGSLCLGHRGGGMSCVQWYLADTGRGVPRGLWLNGRNGSLTVVAHDTEASLLILDAPPGRRTERFTDEWGVRGSSEDFMQAMKGRLDHLARLESDLATLAVGFAAAESARTGGIIRLR